MLPRLPGVEDFGWLPHFLDGARESKVGSGNITTVGASTSWTCTDLCTDDDDDDDDDHDHD